jgi:hypothetical protein
MMTALTILTVFSTAAALNTTLDDPWGIDTIAYDNQRSG